MNFLFLAHVLVEDDILGSEKHRRKSCSSLNLVSYEVKWVHNCGPIELSGQEECSV